MSAVFVGGDAADFLSATAPVTTFPVSVACWFKTSDVTGGYTAVSLADNATNGDWFRLEARGDVGGDPVRWDVRGTGTGPGSEQGATSTSYSANVWNHALGVSSGDTSHTAYLNGAGKQTGTIQVNPLNVNSLAIGVLNRSSQVNWFDGKIAEVAVWNAVLDDTDAATLAAGAPATAVKLANLQFYATLLSSAVDVIAARSITNNSSVTFDGADHPTITSSSSVYNLRRLALIPGCVPGQPLRSY